MFTVIFKDNTNNISTQQIAYGKDAVEPEMPTRPKEAWGMWGFKEWDNTWTNIKENTVINAVFEKKLNQYTVTFVDYDGSVLGTQTVFQGSSATAPTEPTREGYTFEQWDKDYSNVVESMTVTAVYEKTHVHEYTEEVERKDATCIEKGYITSKCSCGDTETKELDVNPDNHSRDTEVKGKKEASCTEKGYTGDTYCKSCDTKISDGIETDLAEHTPGEIVVENRIEPTTEEKGSYDEVIYCEICKKELSRNTVEISIIDPEDSEDEEEEDPEHHFSYKNYFPNKSL